MNDDDKLVRRILILVAIAFVLLIAAGYGAYRNLPRILGYFMPLPEVQAPTLPELMKEPHVVLGEDLLERTVFYSDPRLGHVTDIRPFLFRPNSEPLLAVVGNKRAVFLSTDNAPARTVEFPEGRANRVVLVDLNGDGAPEFLGRGSWMLNVVLFDVYGRELWNYGDEVGVNDAAAGDMDGDGSAEIVVGFNGDGGVHLLDARGNRLWRKSDGNVWQVAMVDTDGDNRPEIVHSNVGGDLIVRDAHGTVVLERDDMNTYFSDFSLTDWGSDRASGDVVGSDDSELLVFTVRGDRVARLPAPGCLGVADPYGTTWRHPSGEVYYAALATYAQWDRTALYVYDDTRALVY